MKRTYDNVIRKISVKDSVNTYKGYLSILFYGMEVFLGKYLKFDMQGFTQSQIMSMSSYERLLIELGEKSYITEEEQFPVEMRLLFMAITNCAVFISAKMIENNPGNIPNLFKIFNMYMGSTAPVEPQNQPKRKMKGPSINLE
jgi:hypothetical protein